MRLFKTKWGELIRLANIRCISPSTCPEYQNSIFWGECTHVVHVDGTQVGLREDDFPRLMGALESMPD